ncbi:MAG: transporter substrate-binding domain-containing protein [Bilophila wadsworthia]
MFSKDNAELAAQVNKGLKAIRENGKEKAIRNKWLGE